MKKILLLLVVWTGIASSCKYDDDELWGGVDDLANRISALEALTQQMNGDIAAMQAIVTALENQESVSEVEKLTDGYILHFTNGTTAVIKNGTDGADGEDGKDGADGEDGKDGADGADGKDAPVMGIEKENGVYYWTLTVNGKTDWLTDDAGNKIAVTGPDGADGEDGTSGSTGNSAHTPVLSVDKDGYWIVSCGETTGYIRGEDGAKISAWGVPGQNGVAKFREVTVGEGTITIVMNDADRTEYVLPLLKGIEFYTDEACTQVADIKHIPWNGASTTATFYYKLNLEDARHQVVDNAGMNATIDEDKKSVTVSLKGSVVTDGRLVLLFFNETRTLTAVFKFVVAPWDGTASAEVTPVGDVYGIATPANLKWVAEQVNGGDSFEGKTIQLLNDIDLAGHAWTPIGENSDKPFSGIFDGNGKTIKGLQVGGSVVKSKALSRNTTTESTATTKKGAGLFGVVKGATLKGVTIKDAVVNPSEQVDGAGILVGCALESVTFEDVTIAQEEVTETAETNNVVQGSRNVGTVAGLVSASQVTVKDCEVQSASVTATATETASEESTSAGGVIGKLEVISSGDETETPKVEISGCKVDGVDLSASTESGSTGTSSSAGGVVGSLTIEDEGTTIEVKGNDVKNAQVADTPSEETGNTTATQGAVVGNLADLDASVSAGIIKDNTVSEEVQIETQLTVANLTEVLKAAVTGGGNHIFDVKGSELEAVTEIEVPSVGADITLNFASLVTSESQKLTIKEGEGATASRLTINMTEENQYLHIETPQTTVTLASGRYVSVSALTAKNTLIVEKDVTIDELIVEDGGVEVFGHVVNLKRGSDIASSVELIIREGGRVDNIPAEGFDLIEGNPGEQEMALKRAAKNGGSFTVTEYIRLTSPLIVEKDFVLNFDNGAFDGDEGQFRDSRGWKAMVIVKPGATFTYDGGGYFNTGHKETQLSCIRMVGGSEAPSKVIMNGGSLIGTYHAILIDEDCRNAEVEINGGSLSCDWFRDFNGSAVLNKSNAEVTMKGGNVSGCASAVEMWGGRFTMTGGTLDASYEGEKSHVNTSNVADNCIIGTALALYPTAGNEITATISDGVLKGLSALYEIPAGSDSGSVTLSVTGGRFESVIYSTGCRGFITGGQFKVKPDAVFIVDGKTAVLEGDYYELKEGTGDVENGASLPSWGKENLGSN